MLEIFADSKFDQPEPFEEFIAVFKLLLEFLTLGCAKDGPEVAPLHNDARPTRLSYFVHALQNSS